MVLFCHNQTHTLVTKTLMTAGSLKYQNGNSGKNITLKIIDFTFFETSEWLSQLVHFVKRRQTFVEFVSQKCPGLMRQRKICGKILFTFPPLEIRQFQFKSKSYSDSKENVQEVCYTCKVFTFWDSCCHHLHDILDSPVISPMNAVADVPVLTELSVGCHSPK